jgi:hypothetical protein
MPTTPKPGGTWDWDGACFREGALSFASFETVSVGIFRWESKKNGKGTKRGPVRIRLKGGQVDREAIRKQAVHVCWTLNNYGAPGATAEEQMAAVGYIPGQRTIRK